MILPQKEIVYKSLRATRQKIPVTGRKFLSQEEISRHRTNLDATGRERERERERERFIIKQ